MKQYMMLTRPDPEQSRAESLKYLENEVDLHFPEVEWLGNFAVQGPYSYLDLFEAPNDEIAAKVAIMAADVNCGSIECWPVVDREAFEAKNGQAEPACSPQELVEEAECMLLEFMGIALAQGERRES